ncbi:MAG: hypothetical protein OXN25_22560 [Candidatus Poribacteria bacterium]|nr:hypothetical protein [Candidatus Poribacteria bacterium]
MKKIYPKRVNPNFMLTRFAEICKPLGMKKPVFRNLCFMLHAMSVAKTFRMNEIATCLPIVVDREKSKQKRLLRFLETPLSTEKLFL